jgi:hypothetical protein
MASLEEAFTKRGQQRVEAGERRFRNQIRKATLDTGEWRPCSPQAVLADKKHKRFAPP